jgi:DNA/RNA endonuclease YhcR with UshA esterase domain
MCSTTSGRRLVRLLGAGALGTVLLAAAVPAAAHHSFAVHFVPNEIITVAGVVDEFRFRNPHGVLTFTATREDGTVETWKAETNSPNILRRRGWDEHSIKPGEVVTVEGYPARDGSSFMRIYRVRFADGRELIGQRPDLGAPGED